MKMFKMADKVRLKEDVELKNGEESICLSGSNLWPSYLTLICISDEKNGYIYVAGYGIRSAHLLTERLRHETPDDLD